MGVTRYVIGATNDGYRIGIEHWHWAYFVGTPKELARQIFERCVNYKFYSEPAARFGAFGIWPFMVSFWGGTDVHFLLGAEPEPDVDIDGVRAALIAELDKLQPLMYFY